MKQNHLIPPFKILSVLLVLALLVLPGRPALANVTGLYMPWYGSSIPLSPDDKDWYQTIYLNRPGEPYSQVYLGNVGDVSKYLVASGYRISIPSGSTINGIEAVIRRSAEGGGVRDHQVRLSLGWENIFPTDRADTLNDWPSGPNNFQSKTYGGPNDLWGRTWTVEEITSMEFGVALSAMRSAPSSSGTSNFAFVDTIQVRVYYTLPATTTTVACGNGAMVFGTGQTCVATVTRSDGTNTPSGTVTWDTDGSGSFVPGSCSLSGTGGSATCSVTYTPAEVGDGSHRITTTYPGSANFTGSSGSQDLTVFKGIAVLSVTNLPEFFNGEGHEASLMSSVPGAITNVRYNGVAALPVDAGIYQVTVDFTPYNTADYATRKGAYAGELTIFPCWVFATADMQTKVFGEPDPELTYQVTGGPLVHGDAFTGELARIKGEDVGIYSIEKGSLALPANYALQFYPAQMTITPANPTLSISNPQVTYNGEPQAAELTSTVAGEVGNIRYDGETTVPVNAGVYAIRADFTSANPNYANIQDATVGSFEIQKATPALSVSNSPQVYDGQPQEAAVTGSIPGEVVKVYYDGDAAAPVNAGTYTITADFVPADSDNYETVTGAAAGSFVIEKAVPALSVSGSPVVYDGQPHAAIVESSVDGAVSHVLYDGEETLPVAPGVYAVTAGFEPTDAANYASLSDAPAGAFIILAAGPALDLEKSAQEETFSYTGAAIHYSYRLTNTGDVPLSGPFTVTDDRVSVTCADESSLAVAAALTCTGSDTVTYEDLLAGKVTNTATAYARYAGEEIISNTVEAMVLYKPANLYFPWIFRMLPEP